MLFRETHHTRHIKYTRYAVNIILVLLHFYYHIKLVVSTQTEQNGKMYLNALSQQLCSSIIKGKQFDAKFTLTGECMFSLGSEFRLNSDQL